jgi:hypothetical protein
MPTRLQIASVWRQLPVQNRRWLILKALIATAAINVVVNAAITWLSVGGEDAVPLWGVPLVEPSTFWTMVGTLFLLPLVTCVLTTIAVHRDVRLGSLASLNGFRPANGWLAGLPSARLRRGVVFGAVVVGVLAPPLTLILVVSGFPELTVGQFVACQVAFAVALGAAVTPIIALRAMIDPPDGSRSVGMVARP